MGKPESARLQQQQQNQQPLLPYPESNHVANKDHTNSTLEKHPPTNQNEAATFARGDNDLQS